MVVGYKIKHCNVGVLDTTSVPSIRLYLTLLPRDAFVYVPAVFFFSFVLNKESFFCRFKLQYKVLYSTSLFHAG